ncbi:glycosyltransferase family 2 protein [Chroogloeocystis siderophila]|jgi:GT2 family glycosyltransferase|uniref:Glycosyl transferase family 2 n=1 Tax=Chroogloeocystis siderophila 5.2 s.c.1 TaxID=247279 RepID=A0A1U7HWS2_9CHRO|nr:glycosyltransferase [Chroogloeocystis siderophila]OKH28036.1 glycosyl transferase family 2 [Chroogloeocystis siderophila 5.2 s.c.1]
MSKPQVTIVVSPRERFSCTQASLESIYENTQIPFKLVYVDGGSPAKIKRYLEEKAQEKQFQLIRTEHYLSPNKARNLGLAQVNTEYVVFIDNDVVVTPGWLRQLVKCAEETNATVVSPLICQGEPVHEEVHCAGGESGVKIETKGDRPRRRIIEKIYKQGRKVADVRPQLQRQQTGLAEFHCMMVRTAIFETIGMLDEALLNTKEHVDFCMTVMEAGGNVYLEPDSLVTYVPGPPLELTDMPFYMLRWSDAWELASLHRLRDKWNLTEDEYFKNRYSGLGWRRKMTIIKPFSQKISKMVLKRPSKKVENLLVNVDKALNKYLTDRYARKQPLTQHQTPQLQQQKSPTTV